MYYNNENKDYSIRIFTPSSREDWLLALEYIKALAKKFDSKIISETGEEYTAENIDEFDYEYDVLYGIKTISSGLQDEEVNVYNVYGINRVVSFNQKMIDKIENSDSPIDTFSDMVKEIQYLDAFSANQQFFRNKEDGKIMGAYTLTQNLRTILPYEPSVEFENIENILESAGITLEEEREALSKLDSETIKELEDLELYALLALIPEDSKNYKKEYKEKVKGGV